MRLSFIPKTTLGKWPFGLATVMLVLFCIGMSFITLLYKSVSAGDTTLKDIASRPALALTMLAGMVSGISAFVIGLIAIIRQKEHALFVYSATLIGALLIVLLLGEFLSPHQRVSNIVQPCLITL